MQRLWRSPKTKVRRLLRILLVWVGSVSASSTAVNKHSDAPLPAALVEDTNSKAAGCPEADGFALSPRAMSGSAG